MADDREHGKLSRGIKRSVDVTTERAGKLAHQAEWIFGRRAARVLGVVALFAVVVALLLVFLNWYVAPTKPSEKKDLVLALAQILAGTALLSGLYFTWRTLQVNREGQITERFTRAIDQLGKTDDEGNKLFEIRLGGIYALERIARESEEDYWPIMEVLTAYVRQHARWLPWEQQEGAVEAAVEKKSKGDSREEAELAEVRTHGPDIQAIMTVLRRRSRSYEHGEPEPLDLHHTNLSRAHLNEVNLSGAHLNGVNLSSAKLGRANLSGAELLQVNLSYADLVRADLQGAHLTFANLSYAHLTQASLAGTHLETTDLERAVLDHADLQGARLVGAKLVNALLGQAKLSDAQLSGADLSGASLWNADLTEANLTGANLTGADLRRAEHLTQEQLEVTSFGDENTKLPPHLNHPAHWGEKTDE